MTGGAMQRRELHHDGQRISYLVKGDSGPTTLYLHGLGADAAQTRPLSSGVAGRSVLVDLPSHGESDDLAAPTTFDALVAIGREVAKREHATRALGVSLGSAVLLRWVTTYDDLDAAALYLPAALSAPRPAGRLKKALTGTDDDLAAYVGAELPADVAGSALAQSWLADRSVALRRPGIAAYADLLECEAPVLNPAAARANSARVLAIGAADDGIHPAAVAQEVGVTFQHGQAHVFAGAAPLWTARRELRALISGFFDSV